MMRLYPAIDILGGSAVRLVKGDFDARKVYDEDPSTAAERWVNAGARQLHVVDLDGARRGEPVNTQALRRIAGELDVRVQFGGGLRTAEAVGAALRAGAARVVLGTAAFTDPALIDELIATNGPERIVVAVDVRGGLVATHGWLQSTEVRARDAFARLREQGVQHFVFTNIDQDGTLEGANRDEVVEVSRSAGEGSLLYSGGIGAIADLEKLAQLREHEGLHQLAGVIVGTALYERRFTVAAAEAALASSSA